MHLFCWNIRNPWNAHPEKVSHSPDAVREHLPGMQQSFLHPPQELPLHFPWCLPPHVLQRRLPARQPVEQPQFPEEQIQSLRAWNVFPSSVIRSGWTPWYLMHCTPSIVIQGHFCLVDRLFCLEWMDAPWIRSLSLPCLEILSIQMPRTHPFHKSF